ncbi:hypothetical protein B0H13DRAFT_2373549 [Mycena leptocephala]|nr:hypothetical protein B0H13DRAFT_2373549 [Mycena leptocephala]
MEIPLPLNFRPKHPIIGSSTVKSLSIFKNPFFATLGPVAPSKENLSTSIFLHGFAPSNAFILSLSIRAIFRPELHEIFAIRGGGDGKLLREFGFGAVETAKPLNLPLAAPPRIPPAPTLYSACLQCRGSVLGNLGRLLLPLRPERCSALLALRPPASPQRATSHALRPLSPSTLSRDVFVCARVSPSLGHVTCDDAASQLPPSL